MKKSIGAKTIVYPNPVFIVGTFDEEDRPNIMAAAWAGVCCSRPPCVSVSLRRATYTYGSILSRRAFTISLPTEDSIKEIDYVGTVSGRDVDKFDTLGLTPINSDIVDAPYVAEFPLVLECRLLHKVEIGLHTQFIGEIVDIKAEESVLDENGRPHIERIKPVIFSSGPRAYYGLGAFLGDAFAIGRKV